MEGGTTERPIGEMGDELASLWAHVSAAMARWLGLLHEFDGRAGWAEEGFRTCAEWVAWRCSIAPVTAREYVRVARRLAGMPAVREAFARGELSYSKVRALTRIEDELDDDLLLTYAQHATAAQLVRIVAAYRGVTRQEAWRAHEQRRLSVVPDEDGTYVVRGRLCAEDGALLARALERFEEAPVADEEDRDPAAARLADALVRLAEHGLAAPSGGRSDGASDGAAEGAARGASPYEIVVHVDAAALAAPDAARDLGTDASARGADASAEARPDRCDIADRARISRDTARRLCCDGGLVGLVERDGEPLSVGRRTRAIPPAIRRALRSRQRSCAFPGCDRSRWLDAHHVEHWADGGATELANLVHLCRHHHRLVHEGGWSLRRRPGGEGHCFVRPDGREHAVRPPRSRGDHRAVSGARGTRAGAMSPASLRPRAEDLRFDLGLTIDALLDRRRRE